MSFEFTPERTKIIKAYIKAANQRKKHLSRKEFEEIGYNKNKVEYHFGSLSELRRKAKEYDPAAFKNVIDVDLYNPSVFAEIKEKVGNFNKFVVTTAVTGCAVHTEFLKTLKAYCKTNNAALLILPICDPAHTREGSKWNIPSELKDELVVFHDLALNNSLFISGLRISAKHIDPITGLGRIGSRHGSFIFASPKQRLKYIATSNTKLSHAMMTTGAITKPNYNTNLYMSERTAYIAETDHVMGALIIDIESNDIFHFRQIQADKTGYFFDMGQYYDGDITGIEKPEALVLGDWHSGETDPKVVKCWIDLIQDVKPDALIFHDLFSGISINHHDNNKNIVKAIKANNKELDLKQELIKVAADLNKFSTMVDEIIITKGNHDEFLNRYLEEGKYVTDPQNHHLALKLAIAMIEGKDPLRYGVEMMGLDHPEKIKWLNRDEDYRIARVELGAHGDRGSNGSKGSLRAMENAYGNSVSGHCHCAEILRGAWSVGTSTHLKLSYNVGPSSWTHSSCLVYSNGMRQLINSINGKYKSC